MNQASASAQRAFIGLGANLGDASGTVRAAWQALSTLPGCRAVACSSLYRTAPVDATGPDFINAVGVLQTSLSALALLAELQALELRFGRERPYRNAPRTLDLDLLFLGDHVMDDPVLTLPHPRLHQRAFALVPLAEVAPGLVLPGLGPIEQLLPGVADQAIERLPD
jgi:2-amino-4-hydroxy-6-hydroxymethyldihydropteridine diphosphokinase